LQFFDAVFCFFGAAPCSVQNLLCIELLQALDIAFQEDESLHVA
jgi:hypothetical protein